MVTLDRFDRRILRLIQRDNRRTAGALAEHVGLSPSACHRRLARPRREGVIEADISVIDPCAVGHGVTLVVTVTLECEHSDVVSE